MSRIDAIATTCRLVETISGTVVARSARRPCAKELAAESERARDGNRRALLERAHRADRFVVRDEPCEVRVRGDRQLRQDRANLTPRDELQDPGLRNPGRLRDVARDVDVLRNRTGTKHGCACGYFKSLAAVTTRIMKPMMRLFGLKSPILCGGRLRDLWCFQDACPIYDAPHEEAPRRSRNRAVLLGNLSIWQSPRPP
jgi:hypothetical protein